MDNLIIDTFAVNPAALDALEQALEEAETALTGVGAMVKPVRQRLGWSQSSLARHVGVSTGKMASIEAGKALPELGEALALVKWVRVTAPLQQLPGRDQFGGMTAVVVND